MPKLVLIVLLIGLLAADRMLDRIDQEQQQGRVRASQFLPADEAEDLLVAAVTVRQGDGPSFLYGRADGLWRCLDLYRVLASEVAISQLLESLRNASGIEQVSGGENAVEYGFDSADTWHVTFHGPGLMKDPDRDVRLEVDVGHARPSMDGCFLRRSGEPGIWAVDTNPRALLDDAPGGAPLLEPGLVPAIFPGDGHTVVVVELERRGDKKYALAMRQVERTPAQRAAGDPGIRWVIEAQGVEDRELSPIQAISYLSFLRMVRRDDVLDPEKLAEWGMNAPMARIVLQSDDGRDLSLVVGPPGPGGLHAVVDGTMKSAYLVSGEIANLLTPDAEQFIFAERNPWEGWLQR